MVQVIGLGTGGHAKVVIEILKLNKQIEIVGLLDESDEKVGTELAGLPILGNDSLLADLHARGVCQAFIGVGTVGHSNRRPELFDTLRSLGFEVISAIHPTAIISASAQIGSGATIMAGVVINAGAHIGDNVIINTGAIVDHDCIIGNHTHIATGACLSGGVIVGNATHIGAGAVIRQEISIGRNSVVGAGAVVVNNVPDDVVVIGIPARAYRETTI
jgi:sugar O-acyltransferase (sialic acid O-acetyltransferase NeuD family)